MALVINDRVKENSTTSGTGTLDLDGAVTGFDTFVSGIGDTNTTYYAIFEQGTANWEVGLGTVTDAATDTLARTTVITNSLGNTDKISFAGSTLDVFCTLPASKAVYLDASGDPVGVSGGQITDETKTFSNYSVLTANRTLTAASDTNYMLVGPIDVGAYVWDVDMVLTII
jgi:hypothetical protein